MSNLISRQTVIDTVYALEQKCDTRDTIDLRDMIIEAVAVLPSAEPEIIRCNDCIFGYLCIDVQNGITDSWIECRNPEGLNRDVSIDGYCSASIRRKGTDE